MMLLTFLVALCYAAVNLEEPIEGPSSELVAPVRRMTWGVHNWWKRRFMKKSKARAKRSCLKYVKKQGECTTKAECEPICAAKQKAKEAEQTAKKTARAERTKCMTSTCKNAEGKYRFSWTCLRACKKQFPTPGDARMSKLITGRKAAFKTRRTCVAACPKSGQDKRTCKGTCRKALRAALKANKAANRPSWWWPGHTGGFLG